MLFTVINPPGSMRTKPTHCSGFIAVGQLHCHFFGVSSPQSRQAVKIIAIPSHVLPSTGMHFKSAIDITIRYHILACRCINLAWKAGGMHFPCVHIATVIQVPLCVAQLTSAIYGGTWITTNTQN